MPQHKEIWAKAGQKLKKRKTVADGEEAAGGVSLVCTVQFSCGIIFLNSNGAANGKESSEAKCNSALGS